MKESIDGLRCRHLIDRGHIVDGEKVKGVEVYQWRVEAVPLLAQGRAGTGARVKMGKKRKTEHSDKEENYRWTG